MHVSFRLSVCLACPAASCAGVCVCTINGRPVQQNAARGSCPLDRFGLQSFVAWAAGVRWLRAGDLAAWLFARLGVMSPACCSCSVTQHRMNRIGYAGCWRIRAALLRRFVRRAEAMGVRVEPADGFGLASAALGLAAARCS